MLSATRESRGRWSPNGVLSACQERQERVEKLSRMLDVRDVPAVGHHHPCGTRYVVSCCSGELYEVAQPGSFLRRGVLAERHHVILFSDNQQGRGLDEVIFMTDGLL